MIAKVTLTKIDGEYILKARDENGKRLPECDYFTDCKQDAEDTRKVMLAPFEAMQTAKAEKSSEPLKAYMVVSISQLQTALAIAEASNKPNHKRGRNIACAVLEFEVVNGLDSNDRKQGNQTSLSVDGHNVNEILYASPEERSGMMAKIIRR